MQERSAHSNRPKMSSSPRVPVLHILAFLLGLLAAGCRSNEVLGCGGFVKSHADIDFSQITVKLYTKGGSLKDQTECAPNTGYYFLPVYDKGDYILKLEPPRGWSFDPTEIVLNIDGSSADPCSQGKDINFVFKGFGITGKVVTVTPTKNEPGPKGVAVLLYDQQNKTLLGSTVTAEGGAFSFTPVQPGKYVLVANHPTWLMEKHSTNVVVREGNTNLRDGDLSVFGFDVSGRVTTTEGEPVGKVYFILFGLDETASDTRRVKNCPSTTPPNNKIFYDMKTKSLCVVTSDDNGRFVYPAVSPGKYKIMPYYVDSKTAFDVEPNHLSISVTYDSLILPEEFKVNGFTVSGKVMASIQPPIPLPGAKVFLSKKQIAVTNKDGAYKTDKVKGKQYMLHAEANDVLFEEKPVKVSPSNPELPTIVPAAFKVSGKVSSTTKSSLQNRKMLIKNTVTNIQQEIVIDPNTGEWSVYLASTRYQLNVIVNDEEKAKGLQFFPLERLIDVSSAPLKDVNFLQLKATLRGKINCKPVKDSEEQCSQVQVTLKMVDGIVETKTIKAKNKEYVFEDVLPGHYEVIVDTDIFCWEASSHQVVIASEKPPNVPLFVQTGYSVTFISSHETTIEYSQPTQDDRKLSIQLQKGSTRACVPVSGKYDFYPKGCHKYPVPAYTWNTNEQTPIILSSTEHLVTSSIFSPIAVDDISVRIEGDTEGQAHLVYKNLKSVRDREVYKYVFSFHAVTGETYLISPSSEALLFDPPSHKITGPDDCQTDVAIFHAEKGKIISGFISPPLEGVTIKIFGRDKEAPVHTLVTQKDGTFRVGPLDGSVDYSIAAEKESFVLTRDGNTKEYKFLARKLAEINVEVVDAQGETPLQGVLLSLSGGGGGPSSYRKNIATGEEGRLIFNSLSPGEYYLRPTMKEYRFEPPSKMIRVEEGKTVRVRLVGRRVAYSAYGLVTYLNGEPGSGLLVEARGQNDCADLQEETTSKEDGTWRIRGLEPKCIYAIRLKLNEQDLNSRALRAIPSSIAVHSITEDVHDIKFMAFQPVSRTDVSIRVISNAQENYRTLKVKLCREDSPDSPIHIAKVDTQFSSKMNSAGFLIHFPPLQADGKKYFVQLETSLSKSTHEYKVIPVYFEANSLFKYVELHFDAERRHDQGDANQITFVPLPLIILVTAAFFYREALSGWLNTTVERWTSRRVSTNSRNSNANTANLMAVNDPRIDDIIVEQIKNINSKTAKKAKPRKA